MPAYVALGQCKNDTPNTRTKPHMLSRHISSQIQMACLWMSLILLNLCSSTEVQQMLPTVLFHWRVWEVKDDGKPIKKVHLLFLIHSKSAQPIPSIPPGLIPKWTYNVYAHAQPFSEFNDIPAVDKLEVKPVGALILAIQAVWFQPFVSYSNPN